MLCKKILTHFPQKGLAYLAVLFLVMAISISMLVVTQNEETLIRREKELDWLFIGQQYQKAITQYYQQSPNGLRELPLTFDDLILDKRFLEVKRHLRKTYPDPLTGKNWIEIRNLEGRLIGVKSASQQPIFLKKTISVILQREVLTHTDVIFEFKQENQSDDKPTNPSNEF